MYRREGKDALETVGFLEKNPAVPMNVVSRFLGVITELCSLKVIMFLFFFFKFILCINRHEFFSQLISSNTFLKLKIRQSFAFSNFSTYFNFFLSMKRLLILPRVCYFCRRDFSTSCHFCALELWGTFLCVFYVITPYIQIAFWRGRYIPNRRIL